MVSFVSIASLADAQMYESVGIRAQGMGGAFTAVADDASATWWNPAGIAGGPYFDTLVEYGRPDSPADAHLEGVAMGFPALGLSYYRLPVSQMRPVTSTAADATGRQDQGYLSQFGATFGQSIGGHLVLATTVKLLHAGDTQGDLDAGAMVTAGHLRFGVSVRNLRQSTFGSGADAWSLKRESRAGVAFVARGTRAEFTADGDADLTHVTTFAGDVQHVSGGAELWLFKRILGVRSGLSDETIGSRWSRSGGLSLMLQQSRYTRTYVEGQLTGGSDEVRRGWGVGLRLTF